MFKVVEKTWNTYKNKWYLPYSEPVHGLIFSFHVSQKNVIAQPLTCQPANPEDRGLRPARRVVMVYNFPSGLELDCFCLMRSRSNVVMRVVRSAVPECQNNASSLARPR